MRWGGARPNTNGRLRPGSRGRASHAEGGILGSFDEAATARGAADDRGSELGLTMGTELHILGFDLARSALEGSTEAPFRQDACAPAGRIRWRDRWLALPDERPRERWRHSDHRTSIGSRRMRSVRPGGTRERMRRDDRRMWMKRLRTARPRFPSWRFGAALVAVLAVAGSAIGCGRALEPTGDGEWYRAGSLDELRAQRIVYLPEIETFVLAPLGEDPYALATDAPDGDGRVLLCRTSGWFFVPDGPERFDIHGHVRAGTTATGMSARAIRVIDGQVEVQAGSAISLPAVPPDPDPSGPMCDEGSEGFEEVQPGFAEPVGSLRGAEDLPFEVTEGVEPGDVIASPGFIGGDVEFEASEIVVRLLGPDGSVLHEEKGACDSGRCPGYAFGELIFTVDAEQPGTVLVGTGGSDGRVRWFHHIPVTLAPDPGVDPDSYVGTWYDAEGNPTYFKDAGGWHLILHVINGAEHCGWQSASYLTLAWPVGSDAQTGNDERHVYVRDPEGVFTGEFDLPPPDLDASLPTDAAPTGYHRGPWELWSSPTDLVDAVYLVSDDGAIERWPRARQVAYCA